MGKGFPIVATAEAEEALSRNDNEEDVVATLGRSSLDGRLLPCKEVEESEWELWLTRRSLVEAKDVSTDTVSVLILLAIESLSTSDYSVS